MDEHDALRIAAREITATYQGEPASLRSVMLGASTEDGAAIAAACAHLAARAMVELDAVLGEGAGLALLAREADLGGVADL